MNPLHRFTLLLALLGSAAVADDRFRIMDEAEMARHKAQLTNLQGQAREDYRNQVWQALRQRARTHGYRMPETPPWAVRQQPAQAAHAEPAPPPQPAQTAPPSPGSGPADASQATAEAAMPQRIEKHRQVIEQAADRRATAPPDDARAKASIAAREYQQQMRERFERFMAQRRARQEQARQQRKQARAQREAVRRQQAQQHWQPTWPPAYPPAHPAPGWPAPPAWPSYPPQHPPAWPGYPPMAPRPPYWY